jgi:hypothetical protein
MLGYGTMVAKALNMIWIIAAAAIAVAIFVMCVSAGRPQQWALAAAIALFLGAVAATLAINRPSGRSWLASKTGGDAASRG